MEKNKNTKYKKSNDYNNPNGEISIDEMIKIKNENNIEEFLKNFDVCSNPCPNKKLRPINGKCFYCIDCIQKAFDNIKEYKNYYKINNNKYSKLLEE